MIDTTAERPPAPQVEDVEGEGRIDRKARVKRQCRLPRLVAHTGHGHARCARAHQRHAAAIAGHGITARVCGAELHLQALDRAVGIAHSATDRTGLAQHVPWLQRLPDFELRALVFHLAAEGEPELGLRLIPFRPEDEAVIGKVP